MRVLISGASGLVGSEVARQLETQGHEAIRLVRRRAVTASEVEWNPATGSIPAELMDSIDAVVNMAGATTGKIPWTAKYKKEIVSSRIDSTRTLVEAMAAVEMAVEKVVEWAVKRAVVRAVAIAEAVEKAKERVATIAEANR